MEFDKSKIYTAVNAEELKVGDKVYIADNIYDLKYNVENDCNLAVIIDIYDYTFNERFKVKFCCNENPNCYDSEYYLAYLVEVAKEKKWRPFKDIDELESAWVRKTNIPTVANTMPLIWLKNNIHGSIECISAFCNSNEIILNGWLVSMEALLENYEFLDGTPCGVED